MTTIPARWRLTLGLFLAPAVVAAIVAYFFQQSRLTSSTGRIEHGVTGGSMAEFLLGEHYALTCADCRFGFHVDAADPPLDDRAVCPNCGQSNNPIRDEQLSQGDMVRIEPLDASQPGPQRWDVVAFELIRPVQQMMVKRVVGLPGEKVSIRGGDLYVNGRIVRKSIEQLRRLALLVHDDQFQPELDPKLPPRWQSDARNRSRWQVQTDRYLLQDSAPDEGETDDADLNWLVYHHWPCLPSLAPSRKEAPIKDNYGYNQGLSRQLFVVTDLMIRCRLNLREWKTVALRIDNGMQPFTVQLIRPSRRIELLQGTTHLAHADLPNEKRPLVELAFCDRQVLLAINGKPLIDHDLAAHSQAGRPEQAPDKLAVGSATPLAIGAAGRWLEIESLQVWRDVHYLDPSGRQLAWTVEDSSQARPWTKKTLRPELQNSNEYFVLGDNVPISVDSRHWPRGAVTRKQLIGKVLERIPTLPTRPRSPAL